MGRHILATDTFVRADAADLGANWTRPGSFGLLPLHSNQCMNADTGNDDFNFYNAVTPAANQWASAVLAVYPDPTISVMGITLRYTATGNFYSCQWFNGRAYLGVWTASVRTLLVNQATVPSISSVLSFEAVGNVLTGYTDGVAVVTTTDSTWTGGGNAGLAINTSSTGPNTDGFGTFAMGDFIVPYQPWSQLGPILAQ